MEHMFSLEYGVTGVVIMLAIHLLVKVGEFLWGLKEKKESASEQAVLELTKAVEDLTDSSKLLDVRIRSLESSLSELPKIKVDIRRFYTAVKIMSGEKWPDIRKQITEDDLSS